jgi:ribonuclease PH
LTEFGNTKVICTVNVENSVPGFLRNKQQGWLTAEYGMLPGATHSRSRREASQRKQSGRTMEIQRLIGRSLRSIVDLKKLGERTLLIDCDVIQADGGTRTAAITGTYVALMDAIQHLQQTNNLQHNPVSQKAAAVSVGIYRDRPILDLDYAEDANAETDMNIVMNDQGRFIEIQGTAEGAAFDQQQLDDMLALAKEGIQQLLQYQAEALAT